MNDVLHIHNLSVGYKLPLMESFNLRVKHGEMLAITGKNGSGKTTLLRTIAGLMKPLHGQIHIGEKNIHELSNNEQARLVSITLTQRIALQGIDVKTLVMMGRYPMQGRFHFGNSEDDMQVMHCIDRMQIGHLANEPLARLSDGESQKAMIAKSLAQQTPLLLMDEPTAFLDYEAKEDLMRLLRSLCETENLAVLFTSHDLELVRKYADNRIEIEKKIA
ncbi:MAG: ABC transporter ATP-binding protein [Flavobacteriales bacterium]